MQSQAAIPKLSGDIRPLIAKLGLRHYWYPAVVARVSVRYLQEQMRTKAAERR